MIVQDRLEKATFAQANALHLITIPYTDFDRIGTIIIDHLTEATGVSPLEYKADKGKVWGSGGGMVKTPDEIQLSLLRGNKS